MASSATRLGQTALFGLVRATEFFRGKWFYLCLLVPIAALGLAGALTAKPDASSAKAAIEYFQQKAADRAIRRVEVYYINWRTFMLPMTEDCLRDSAWTCKSIVKFPILTSSVSEELARMGEELATMELEPVKVPVKDFRLLCVITISEDEKPLVLSFSRNPLSVCVNGEAFKPSWKLFLGVSQFLPSAVRSPLLASIREDWALQGYPKIPEDGEGGSKVSP